jgi:hypothetical protein
MNEINYSPPVNPIPANIDPTKPPMIVQPSSKTPWIKIFMGIVPVFAFVVTGIISFSMINNSRQKLTYQSSAKENVTKPKTNQYATLLPEASSSGCVLSLRYDATESASLKDEAKTELTKIKSRLENNEKGEDLLFEILNGQTKVQKDALDKERSTNRDAYLAKLKTLIGPFSKFQPENSPNFCFKNTKEINDKLTVFFYNLNPDFQTNFVKTAILRTSEPFQIYKSTQSGKTDYGWMLISK